MARGNQYGRLRLLDGIFALTILSSISQVHASVFGRSDFYNAFSAREIKGVATAQEPALLLPGLYPRSWNGGTPMESSWRYTGGGAGPNAGIELGIFRRQTTGEIEAYCNQGNHVCRAFAAVGCCGNDAYCIITEQGEGKCCPLGSVCGEDPCKQTSTYCTQIMTITATPTDTAATAEITTTTSTGCCARACALTMHLCDIAFGGFCCGNDAACIPSKMCQPTPNPNMPTSTTVSKITTTTVQCETGSIACAEAAGGGCCPDNMICTEISSTPGCALSGSGVKTRQIFTQTTSATPSADGFNTDAPSETPSITGTADGASDTGAVDDPSTSSSSSSSSGLSAGAKAGIGIGAAVGVLAIIAIGAFLFIRHRKKNGGNAPAAELAQPPPNQPPQDPQMMQQYGGYAGQQSAYYAGGTQYPQGYYPAPQQSPVQGYYDPAEALKQQQQGQHGAYGGETGGAVMLPNTPHQTGPTAELPAQ